MSRNQEQILRKQIAETFRKASEDLDRQVAQAFAQQGEFQYHFTDEELSVVFANIFHTLVELHRFAGMTVPLTHNVTAMEVEVRPPRLSVRSILHIHSPIRAFIAADYDLMNHPAIPGILVLRKGSLKVQEKTARFDLVARAALRAIDVEGLIASELQDPAEVIRRTLPHRLRSYGFAGQISTVRLEVTPDGRLQTLLGTDSRIPSK